MSNQPIFNYQFWSFKWISTNLRLFAKIYSLNSLLIKMHYKTLNIILNHEINYILILENLVNISNSYISLYFLKNFRFYIKINMILFS